MQTIILNRGQRKCVFCKYWNGDIGSTTIQILPGGNTFQFDSNEKHSCFKKGRGMQMNALQECPYFIERKDMMNKKMIITPEEESKDVGWWVKVIDVAISTPGVKVNREEFLKKELRGKVSKDVIDDAIKVGTVKAGVPKEVAEKIAENLINSKCILTSAVSFATGIPGGLVGLLGGSTVDIAQFFGNFFNLAQKLMYIYGYKDVSELDSSQTDIMIAMLGAASGVEAAQIFISKQLPKLAEKIAASLIARESAKGIFKKIADKVLVVFGKKGIALFTKGEVAKIIGKSVPLVGGLLSGTLNLITFKPMANKLNKCLKENYDYHENL